MAVRLKTGFLGATNPALTPTPFDSVVEDAGNDIFFGATQGKNAGPGARLTLGNTGGSTKCYGVVDLRTKTADGRGVNLQGHHLRVRLSLSIVGGVLTGFANGNEVTLIRLMTTDGAGVDSAICSLAWVRSATGYFYKVYDDIGGTNFAMSADLVAAAGAATFTDIQFDIVGSRAAEFAQVAQSGTDSGINTIKAQRSLLPGRLPTCTKVLVGAVAMNIAQPAAANEWVIDDLRIEDDYYEEKITVGSGYPVLGSRELEMSTAFCTHGTGALFGAPKPNIGSTSLYITPSCGMRVTPNATYELTMSQQTTPAATTALWTSILPREFSEDEVNLAGVLLWQPDTSFWVPMHTLGRYVFQTLAGQNCVFIFNNQQATEQYNLRRLR